MTLMIAVKLAMTLVTVLFALGYRARRQNNPLHQKLMAAGFGMLVLTAVGLVAGVHLFHGTYGAAPWLVDLMGGVDSAQGVLIAHRITATLAFLALSGQVVTGIRRHPAHRTLARLATPLWLVSYVSGLVVFE